jgi:hypothetical protein
VITALKNRCIPAFAVDIIESREISGLKAFGSENAYIYEEEPLK